MSRWIDAEKAIENTRNEVYWTESEAAAVRNFLNHQPTIDPDDLRPRGMWRLNEDGKWACSECDGLAVEHPEAPDSWQALTKCCPNCGARMRTEGQR